jgi:glutaminyl-tRNA synthetase
MYDRLFKVPNPLEEGLDFMNEVNPDSLRVLLEVRLEPSLSDAKEGESFQFVRQGYYTMDRDSRPDHLVFNQTVSLKEGWTPKE